MAYALVEEYLRNGKEITRINEETALKKQDIKKKRRTELENIDQKKEILKQEEREAKKRYDNADEAADEEEKKQAEPYNLQRAAVRRIITLLELAEKYKPIRMEDGEVRIKEGKILEWQQWIHNDDYLTIRLIIGENDKPKNKYTVAVYGRCAFHEPLIKLPSCYGLSLNESGMHIRQEIGSFKTIDEAKSAIVKKLKQNLFQDLIKDVEALKKEYLEVTATWKLSDFEELFEYRCPACQSRFKHKPETHNGNDGTKCNSPYGFYREVIR
jgi:hypothetical protein